LIVESCSPIILTLVMIEIELSLTTFTITSITKLTEPVMTRCRVCILFSGPLRPSLHTTPHTGLCPGQDLGNPLCYLLLPLLYTLKRKTGSFQTVSFARVQIPSFTGRVEWFQDSPLRCTVVTVQPSTACSSIGRHPLRFG
jgi:hypothetical protein